MAAPSYYDNSTHTILDGTLAAASDVEDKCDDIASSFGDVAADMDNTLRFTNADFTDQTSAANAATRADKVVGFNASGNLELKAGYSTAVTQAQAAQAAAEAAQAAAEAAQGAAETAETNAETAEANAEAAQVAAEAARDLAQGYAAAASSAWSIKTTTYTAVHGDKLVGDTSGGAFTITLPASPTVGQAVTVKATKDASTNNLTIGRNGANINGLATDLTINTNYFETTLVYVGASLGWSM